MSFKITGSEAGRFYYDDQSQNWLDVYGNVYPTIFDTKNPQGLSKTCFGEENWQHLDFEVDPAPPLPDIFSAIWNQPCPIYPGKKIRDTHILTYIPATIDGDPYTLNKLGEIAKRFFPTNPKGFKLYWPGVVLLLGKKSQKKSRWVLMTKDVLPGSKNKSFAKQQKIIAELAKKSLLNYKVPRTLEASTSILSQYFLDPETCLFSYAENTFTRCKEVAHRSQVIVGELHKTAGLELNNSFYDTDRVGVAAILNLDKPFLDRNSDTR